MNILFITSNRVGDAVLSTGLLILCGLAQPTSALLIAALLVTVGAVLASREMWKK